jgi:hypothetical protein
MMTPSLPDLSAMTAAAENEWLANAPEDWTTIDFRLWAKEFHCSAWIVAGYIGFRPAATDGTALRQSRRGIWLASNTVPTVTRNRFRRT